MPPNCLSLNLFLNIISRNTFSKRILKNPETLLRTLFLVYLSKTLNEKMLPSTLKKIFPDNTFLKTVMKKQLSKAVFSKMVLQQHFSNNTFPKKLFHNKIKTIFPQTLFKTPQKDTFPNTGDNRGCLSPFSGFSSFLHQIIKSNQLNRYQILLLQQQKRIICPKSWLSHIR